MIIASASLTYLFSKPFTLESNFPESVTGSTIAFIPPFFKA